MSGQRILITGATGFVGRHLVERYSRRGQPITLALQQAGAGQAWWRDVSTIRLVETGPLEESSNLEKAVAEVSTVIHCAGKSQVVRSDSPERVKDVFVAANATATGKLVDASIASGTVGQFIHVSSIAAVAEHTASHVVDDNAVVSTQKPYGRSKLEAEKHLERLIASGVFAVSLRPPLIIGPDARGNWGDLQKLVWTGIPLPFGSVNNKRSMISIETLSDAIIHLTSGKWPVEMSSKYCVAEVGTISLADMIGELRIGMRVPQRLLPVPMAVMTGLARLLGQADRASRLLGDLQVDGSRFNRCFGFEPVQTIRQAVRECGAAYRQLKVGQSASPVSSLASV